MSRILENDHTFVTNNRSDFLDLHGREALHPGVIIIVPNVIRDLQQELSLLRLPGFANRKYNEAFIVRVHYESGAIHHQQDFHIHQDSPESPKDFTESLGGTRRMPAGHYSQSEADWAYAKRALARGDDPKSSFNASPTIAPTTKLIRSTTRDTRSRKRMRSFRAGPKSRGRDFLRRR